MISSTMSILVLLAIGHPLKFLCRSVSLVPAFDLQLADSYRFRSAYLPNRRILAHQAYAAHQTKRKPGKYSLSHKDKGRRRLDA